MKKEDIQDLLIETIRKSLGELNFQYLTPEDLYLDIPTDIRFGDLSSNIAFRLSKNLGKPPSEIANNIVRVIKKYIALPPLSGCLQGVKVEGAGFINFYLSPAYLYSRLRDILREEKDSLGRDLGQGQAVLIEFVSANPTGPLSVAHARQAALGGALANIFAFLGFKVGKEYYLNDEGNQIDTLGKSVELRLRELNGEKIEFPENYYQGEYIYDIAKKLKDERRGLENIGEYAADYILGIIKQELDDFGLRFDCWYSQKELGKSGKIQKALGFLREKGFLYEQDGALWFKSTQFGDDKDRVVIKSDGNYTYLAPDIAYHQDKYKRGFSWLINLWGPDHHGYISRLRAAVAALGEDPRSLSIIIVQLASIFKQGKPLQMSTRKGQYITLRQVLDDVGLDASRFFFLMRRSSSHLDFDLDIAKKQNSDNPVYYIQYAYARILSIIRNSGVKPEFKDAQLEILNKEKEIFLIKKILQFPQILNICLKTLDPYMLTVYLQEISEAFHKFYDEHRVLGNDNLCLTQARLALIQATRIVIATGLELLGVSQPEKM